MAKPTHRRPKQVSSSASEKNDVKKILREKAKPQDPSKKSATVTFIKYSLFVLAIIVAIVALYTKIPHGDKTRGQKSENTSTGGEKSNSGEEEKVKLKSKDPKADLPDEIKNFKSVTSDKFEVKPITVHGKLLNPISMVEDNSKTSVRAFIIEDFMSEDECKGLVGAHVRHVNAMGKNTPIMCFADLQTLKKHLEDAGKAHVKVSNSDFTEGTLCLNSTFSQEVADWIHRNWSYSTAFYPGESKFSSMFADRVQQATGLQASHGGKFQITSYAPGIGYKTHTDCVVNSMEKRDRFATILVYLMDTEKGGETEFPDLGIKVTPKRGQALVWTNMDRNGSCDPTSVHKAAKVISGHKIILQRWYYYQNFYTIGKRAPEPKIPKREENTARVSCDEYQQGSCRWYDEWNYNHILEYLQQQHTLI